MLYRRKLTKMDSEKKIEAKLRSEVFKKGGWCIKILSTFAAGLPDRLVLIKGQAYFVEVKSEGKVPRPLQRVVHKKLERLGFPVTVISTFVQLDNFLLKLDHEIRSA